MMADRHGHSDPTPPRELTDEALRRVWHYLAEVAQHLRQLPGPEGTGLVNQVGWELGVGLTVLLGAVGESIKAESVEPISDLSDGIAEWAAGRQSRQGVPFGQLGRFRSN